MELFLKNHINIFLNDILLKRISGAISFMIKNKVIIRVIILMLNNTILHTPFIAYIAQLLSH